VAVTNDVDRDTEKPGQSPLMLVPDLASTTPGLEEDDCGELLSLRPVRAAPEAIVVDASRVTLEELAE
jgi:hypothetical protein